MTAAIHLSDISKSYVQGSKTLEVLHEVSLAVAPGEITGLMGQSGAGKSTLLHIAGLLERPSGGEVEVEGRAMAGAAERLRTQVRRRAIGFVYQFHHLLPEFTALENVVLPQRIAGRRPKAARERAEALLSRLGLAERLDHRPAQLSGGEQQRVAIARALANEPQVLLADEPTGNLDEATADRVMDQFIEIAREHGLAVVVATHNSAVAARADKTLHLREGRIATDPTQPPA